MDIMIEQKRQPSECTESNRLILAVSSTFTSEPIEDYIKWWCKTFNEPINIKFAPYNQVFQELLDTSSLISNNTGINLLLLRFEDWIRDEKSADKVKIEKLERNYKELVEIFDNKEKFTPYFIGVFPISRYLSLSDTILNHLEGMNIRWKQHLNNIDGAYIVDFNEAFELYKIDEVFDKTKDKAGHIPFTDEFFSIIGTMIARKICAWKKQIFKVIVLDCDNTLWKGICGETTSTGVDVAKPYMELQKFMLQKYNEGMLLALCSKNNENDVWEVFDNNKQMLLKKEHFAAYRINWKPKSQNIKELVAELNLGIDSFIFLDDSPSECAEVIQNCPEVLTLQLPEKQNHIKMFLHHVWAFDKLKLTKEDMNRTQMYAAEKKRQMCQKEITSLDDFLKGLEIQMFMNVMEKQHISRVSQLTQRTNQFNISTIRRNEKEVNLLFQQTDTKSYIIEVTDRFGEYGIVGVVITKENNKCLFIETLLLSCRVLGKCIEDSILVMLAQYCREKGIDIIETEYFPTDRNQPVQEFLERTRWQKVKETEHYVRFMINVNEIPLYNEFINCYFNSICPKREMVIDEKDIVTELIYEDDISIVKLEKDIHMNFCNWKITMEGKENLLHKQHMYPLIMCSVEKLVKLPVNNNCSSITKAFNVDGSELQQKLKNIIVENIQINKLQEEIDLDLKLTDIGINSITFIKIIVNIEKMFKFKFRNEDLDFYKFSTFKSLVLYVEKRIASEISI